MKRLILILIQCCYILSCAAAPSQTETDSLENLLPILPHDSTRLDLIQNLTRMQQSTPECIRYSNMLLKEAVIQNKPRYAGTAIYFQVIYYYNQNQPDSVDLKLREMEPFVAKGYLWDYYFDAQRCQIDLLSYGEQFELAINKALEMYKKAEKARNIRGLIGANQCLANAYMGTGRLEEGKNALKEAHKLLSRSDNTVVSNSVLCQLISLSKANEDFQNMKIYLDEQQKLLQDYVNSNPNMIDAFSDPLIFNEIYYAYYYVHINQAQKVLEHLQEGAKYLNPHTYFMYQVLYHDAYAYYYRICKEYDQAISRLDTTIVILKETANSDYISQLSVKADILVEAGRSQEALPIYQNVFQLKDSVVNEVSNKQLQLIQKSYHMDKMILEEQISRNQIQIVILGVIAVALIFLTFVMIRVYRIRRALKKAESETRTATRTTEEANESKNRFLSNMSYNIRIPLNGVVGFSQLIASEPDMIESTRKEFATIIQKNTEELMQLVNDVLDLSRLEANMMKFQIHEYDVVSLCNDAIYMARMKGEGYIDILFKTDIPMQNIITDTARLTQTLLDLLTYPDRCNKQREITFTLSRDVEAGLIRFHIVNSPLADPEFISQKVSIRHDINRLLLEHFGGSYIVSTDEQGRTVIDLTYPFDYRSE